jgi:ferredoxin
MKVTVDKISCAATGFCARIAPELFELSDTGGRARAVGQAVGPRLQELAEEAALSCPTGSVVLDRGEDHDR